MADGIFSALKLGGIELANRIVVSPMCMYQAVDGVAQPFHTQHIGTLVNSGAGLVILEATGVSADGRISHSCLGLYTDEQEAALTTLVSGMRSFSSTPIGIQLGHAGRKAGCEVIWRGGGPLTPEMGGWQTVGPSPVPFADGWNVPTELDEAGLEGVKNAYVQATLRAARSGFDLVELHAAHGYLLHQFLSPLTNFRNDQYGGSPENRRRFPIEVAAAVRAAMPADKVVGLRINADDWAPGGATIADAEAFAAALKAVGVDYVTLSGGKLVPETTPPVVTPGYLVPFAEQVRAAVGIPTMTVGMIVLPEQADAIVREGKADMVGIARAFLDDPRWAFHAAAALGETRHYPNPYFRAHPKFWTAYNTVHPAATV